MAKPRFVHATGVRVAGVRVFGVRVATTAVATVAAMTLVACHTSPSRSAGTSASASATVTVTTTAGTPTSAAPPASSPTSAPASVSPSAPASSPAAPAAVVVDLSRSNRTGTGGVKLRVDELSVTGLAASAAISAALEAPATQALAGYLQDVTSNPCTGPACAGGDFDAAFTTTRDDSVVVSGTWSIEEFLPGGAHPTVELTSVIVDAATGTVIPASGLFAGANLQALATPAAAAAKARLNAVGCVVDACDPAFGDGTAPTADNYVATAVGISGLFVGISQGQAAAEACGPFQVAVPWSAVLTSLSADGAKLAAAPPSAPSAPVVASAPASAGPLEMCATTSLGITLGAATSIATGQYRVPVDFANLAPAPCTLLGFPGVDLGAAASQPLSLVRAAGTPARIVLAPGASAHANLTYLTGPDPTCDSAGPWTPTTITITPPDETTSVQLPWAGQSVDDCQAAATHPGSYIGPVVS